MRYLDMCIHRTEVKTECDEFLVRYRFGIGMDFGKIPLPPFRRFGKKAVDPFEFFFHGLCSGFSTLPMIPKHCSRRSNKYSQCLVKGYHTKPNPIRHPNTPRYAKQPSHPSPSTSVSAKQPPPSTPQPHPSTLRNPHIPQSPSPGHPPSHANTPAHSH